MRSIDIRVISAVAELLHLFLQSGLVDLLSSWRFRSMLGVFPLCSLLLEVLAKRPAFTRSARV